MWDASRACREGRHSLAPGRPAFFNGSVKARGQIDEMRKHRCLTCSGGADVRALPGLPLPPKSELMQGVFWETWRLPASRQFDSEVIYRRSWVTRWGGPDCLHAAGLREELLTASP
jgi:hypothetical protein